MNEDDEIKISREIAKEIMGRDVDFIENAKSQANCHDCITNKNNISMKEIVEYSLNGSGDIVLRGVCAKCGSNNCVSYLASNSDPIKLKIAKKYLKNEK